MATDGGPRRPIEVEPMERRTWLAAELMRRHPPVVHDPQKAVILSVAAPRDAVHSGCIEYTRWNAMPLPAQIAPGAVARLLEVRDGWFDYAAGEVAEAARQRVAQAARQRVDARQRVAWHVNFADPRLFGAYAARYFAQDEVQVAEHPALAAVREALLAEGLSARTILDDQPTPVLVAGVERRVAIDTAPNAAEGRPDGLYGGRNLASVTEHALRLAVHPIDPPTTTNVIAISSLRNHYGAYTRQQIEFTLRAAYSGFRAAVLESRRVAAATAPAPASTAAIQGRASEAAQGSVPAPWSVPDSPPRGASRPLPEVVVHTGFWGCGAFGGNRILMTLLQLLAAQLAGIDRLVYHLGDASGRAPVDRALALAGDLTMVTDREALMERIVELGLEWGGDGN